MLFIKSLIKNLLNGRERQVLGSSKVRLRYRHFTFSCSLNAVFGIKTGINKTISCSSKITEKEENNIHNGLYSLE